MNRDWSIRRATPWEGEVLAALQNVCFPDEPWTASSMATLAGQPGVLALLAVGDGEQGPEPFGFALVRVVLEDAEILTLGVPPSVGGRGIGRDLLGAIIKEAAEAGATTLYLEVAEDNTAATCLYATAGFKEIGRRPAYYRRAGGAVAARVLGRPLGPLLV